MIEGALILFVGLVIGFACGSIYTTSTERFTEKPDPYDKYRNKDGLLSRRKVKESG